MVRIHALALAVASALLLSACGPVVSIASNTYPHVPSGFGQEINMFSAKPIAVWTHGKTLLSIVTVGSVDCPPVPTAISAPDAATIDITFVKSPNSPCSVALSPTTHEFKIPAGIDVSSTVTVNVHFDFDTDYDYELAVLD